ncbi:MAG: CPBP family intramembrane metalloprotease [Erysipelotrichales bacterium]|nr:CPBP family intramembrane metalloprotease [Erysipelotrichales bacterium]
MDTKTIHCDFCGTELTVDKNVYQTTCSFCGRYVSYRPLNAQTEIINPAFSEDNPPDQPIDESRSVYIFGLGFYLFMMVFGALIVLGIVGGIAIGTGRLEVPADSSSEAIINLIMDSPFVNVYTNLFYALIVTVGLVLLFRRSLVYELKDFFKRHNIFYYLTIAGALYVAYLLINALYSHFVLDGTTADNQLALEEMFNAGYVVPFFIFVVILAPILEEIVFRKIIFHFIPHDILAILVSAFLFGMLHVVMTGDFIHVFPYLLMGLIFGWIYVHFKKNIYAAIFLHTINNGIAFFALWFLVNNPEITSFITR